MKYMGLAAAALVIASPVAAADLYIPETPLVEIVDTYDWNGFYLGVQVGGQIVNVSTTAANFVQPGGSGFIAGVHAGYNHQADSLVLGVEGDAEYSSFSASEPCDNPAFTCSTYLNWQGSLRGRVGYAADAMLFYLTGGLAVANFGGETNDGTAFPDSSVRLGYTVGGGVEVGFDDNISGRIEYRYSDYGVRDMTYDAVYPAVGVATHAIRVGVSVGM